MANNRRSRNALTTILHTPNRDIHNTNMNPLARLVRVVFADLNIKPNRFHMMLNKYLDDPMNGFHTPEKRSSERGNIQKELAKPNITWKTVVKLVRVLNPKRIRLSLEFDWHDGKTTRHVVQTEVRAGHDIDIMGIITNVNNKVPKTDPRRNSDVVKYLDMLDDDTEHYPEWEDEGDD